MPVRGSGWYKRPYRVIWTDPKRGKQHRAFHWDGPAEELFGFVKYIDPNARFEVVGEQYATRRRAAKSPSHATEA